MYYIHVGRGGRARGGLVARMATLMSVLLRAALAAAAAAAQPAVGSPSPTTGSYSSFDPTVAERLILLSDAAYCGDDQHGNTTSLLSFECPPCKAAAAAGGVVRSIATVQNATRQTMSFVGLIDWGGAAGSAEPAGARIVVSYRGSVLQQNFQDDADQALAPLEHGPGRAAGAHVHRGMYQSYSSIAAPTLAAVQRLIAAQKGAVREIIVTGHSLGAGQAVFGAFDLAVANPSLSVIMYSFGTPRPGDLAFAQLLNRTSNLHTWAIAHRADTVPQCGIYSAPCHSERQLGLHQISGNIWYPEDMVTPARGLMDWVECDGSGEDPHCQDSVAESLLNWKDHNRYLQHSMYCCDRQGNGTAPGKPGCAFPF